MALSAVLTGIPALDAELGEAYLQRAAQRLGAALDALLSRYQALIADGRDPIAAVGEDILPSPEHGPAARTILLLWYTGGFPPDNPKGDWQMQSADQYYRALVWQAIGAHPPTRSNGYFGHWKYPVQA